MEAILVTHTHRDHSPATPAIKAATGAPVYAEGPHRAARPLNLGETNVLDASGDRDFAPDIAVKDGDVVTGTGWTLESVFTPGHTANHMAFALREEQTLFSGDHVMAWSTSIVAPPDGAMGDYMASLDKLRARDETLFWPGHGGPVKEPAKFMRALAHHRRLREAAIMKRLGLGDRHIPDIVAAIYEGLDPRLKSAAGLSVFAHLEDLVGRGLVASDGPASLTGRSGRCDRFGRGRVEGPTRTLPSGEGRETTASRIVVCRLAQPSRRTRRRSPLPSPEGRVRVGHFLQDHGPNRHARPCGGHPRLDHRLKRIRGCPGQPGHDGRGSRARTARAAWGPSPLTRSRAAGP